MKNNIIMFDNGYDGIIKNKIYNEIEDYSVLSFADTNFEYDKLVEIINQYMPLRKQYVTERFNNSNNKKKLEMFDGEYFYIDHNIAITFDDSTIVNKDDIEYPDVNSEDDIKPEKNTVKTVNYVNIYYNNHTKDIKDKIFEQISKIIYVPIDKSKFYTIGSERGNFCLHEQISDRFELDISLHYGEEFVDQYNDIVDSLTNKTHGLMLFHSEPGTGKTTLIKYLISQICDTKKLIYVPSYMIEQVASPDFITFLQKYKKSILVLEDAEFALQARSAGGSNSQAVSNILNLTNGLLNEVTQIQIIATFNTDRNNIDQALLRPGRLLNEWKFDKLSIDQAKKLADHINKDIIIDHPMTVAEVYNGKSKAIDNKKTIGF